MKNFIPRPWILIPKIFGVNLHCEIKGIEIELNKIKDEYLNILKNENFKDHSEERFWVRLGAIGLKTYGGDLMLIMLTINPK